MIISLWMFHIILYQPEIPQNTGNIGRLCAVTHCRLHLIHPIGFEITDKKLRRSGMDYWYDLDVQHHKDWEAFERSPMAPSLNRIFMLTTKAKKTYWEASFLEGDGLLFGNEGSGCPDFLHQKLGHQRLTIPHKNTAMRSLNLANSVSIVVYEALRQTDFVNLGK